MTKQFQQENTDKVFPIGSNVKLYPMVVAILDDGWDLLDLFLLLNYNPRIVVTKFGSNWMSGFPIGSYVKIYPTVAAILDGEQTNQIQSLKRTTSGYFFYQVWIQLAQQFRRRRYLKRFTTDDDRRQVMAIAHLVQSNY